MTVAVFTDSTAFLADPSGVTVVPLRVSMGLSGGIDGVDVKAADVVAALERKDLVTTSRPTPGQFVEAFRGALAAGAEHVVSVHLSSGISGTWESAVVAGGQFPSGVVRVVDSRSSGAALGFAVRAAYQCAEAGGTPGQVEAAAMRTVESTATFFYVDTLEYLRRGGRIGSTAAWLGTSLSVKPLLFMRNGQIAPLEKVRTASKAIARLAQLTVEAAAGWDVDVVVQHLAAAERAELLAAQLQATIAHPLSITVAELSPVIGAHIGPGSLGTAVVAVPRID